MATAQSLIATAHFGPDVIVMLSRVLEDAWATVEPRQQDHREALRLTLAEAIIDLATAGQTDPEGLKDYALLRLRRYMGI